MTFRTRPILVIGESVVDIIKNADGSIKEYGGGSPANVAVALARLDVRVELATAYARDRLGLLLESHFARAGVALAGEPWVLDRTYSAIATIDSVGAATYTFDIAGDIAQPMPSAPPLLVHFGSLAAVLEPGSSTIATSIERNSSTATITYDINLRPDATGVRPALVARVESLAALSDVVKASDEDLEALYPGHDVATSTERLLRLGAGAVVVTLGRQGAACYTAAGQIEVPAETVSVVDTIGAGDSFCAAMLDGLRICGVLGAEHRNQLRALPLRTWGDVLARAGRAAAITVSRPGADPPSTAELDAAHPAPPFVAESRT